MTEQSKTALTAEIKACWILQYENWYIHFMKRRGNKTAFFIVIFSLLLLLFVSTVFAWPFLAFGFFMCYTSIAGGIKERSWAKKYNLLLPELMAIVVETYP